MAGRMDDDVSWRRLYRRWFVEYNPLALLSATFILGGIWLLSREAAQHASLAGHLGVAALAELYALALIGGAWFLVRIGMRRAAAMLGILAAVYQADLTMHVETSAYLGWIGWLASVVWVGLFAVKHVALAAALRLRLSRGALFLPLAGALGLAVLPHVLREVGRGAAETLVGLFVFAIGAAALHLRRSVHGATDVRARRAVWVIWRVWGALLFAHTLYWAYEHQLGTGVSVAALALVSTRLLREEWSVWATSAVALIGAAAFDRGQLWVVALLVAMTLAARALRSPTVVAGAPPREEPYRDAIQPPPARVIWVVGSKAAQARLLSGALASVYLAGNVHARLAPHSVLLGVALAAACVALVWHTRRVWAGWPAAALGLYAAVITGWLPQTSGQWGALAVLAGFGSLALSLAISWRHRNDARASGPPSSTERSAMAAHPTGVEGPLWAVRTGRSGPGS